MDEKRADTLAEGDLVHTPTGDSCRITEVVTMTTGTVHVVAETSTGRNVEMSFTPDTDVTLV